MSALAGRSAAEQALDSITDAHALGFALSLALDPSRLSGEISCRENAPKNELCTPSKSASWTADA